MKTIIVSGASSSSAKTALAAAVLRTLPDSHWAGIKITVTEVLTASSPAGSGNCDLCDSGPDACRIITRREVITGPDTDSGRLVDAGGNPVVWLMATPDGLVGGWNHVRTHIPSVHGAVIESNSLALFIESDLILFAINPAIPQRQWKSNALDVIERSDYVIISLFESAGENARGVIDRVSTLRRGRPVFVVDSVERAVKLPEIEERIRLLGSKE